MKAAILWGCLLILACCPVYSHAKDKHPLQTASVLSQQVNPDQVDSGLMTNTPLVRYSSLVEIETAQERMTWSEVSTYKFGTTSTDVRFPIPLPVNGTIQFYRDGNFCIVRDEGGKKHKFLIVHLEAKTK